MPTYAYRCPEGHEFDEFQKMSDPPVANCPVCGAPGERLISGGAGLLFKGEGFYITDYRSESYRKAAKAESGSGGGSEGGGGGSEGGGGAGEGSKAGGGTGGKGAGKAGGSETRPAKSEKTPAKEPKPKAGGTGSSSESGGSGSGGSRSSGPKEGGG